MSMIKCPECQKEISETSTSCPNCGCPITSETSTLNQKTNIQAEIYKTAFIHSAIIVVESLIVPILGWLLSLLSGAVCIFLQGFVPNPSWYGSIFATFLRVLILINLLWIIKGQKSQSNIIFADKCRTMSLMWNSYALIYCIGSIIKSDFVTHWSIPAVKLQIIITIIVIIISIIGILLISKGMVFRKYLIIHIIWGIFAVMILISAVVFSTLIYYFVVAILTVPLSIAMGILWGVSSSKSKSIQ